MSVVLLFLIAFNIVTGEATIPHQEMRLDRQRLVRALRKEVNVPSDISAEAGQLGLVPIRSPSELGLRSTRPGQLGLLISYIV